VTTTTHGSGEVPDAGTVLKGMALDAFLKKIDAEAAPIRELFADYKCAAMEVETKFKVLDARLSLKYDRNPIESIKTRVKTPESIIRKLESKNYPLTVESIRENIFDIAGVRVICSFVKDIYKMADYLLSQDDITLIEKKDYIRNPKPGGYRSLHLIVSVPIFTENGKKPMNVEVQLRTIAMDFWASLEHKVRYKKNLTDEELQRISFELKDCARRSAALDLRMQRVKDIIIESEKSRER
jgi:putative GTP pyrophosphokinase